MCAAVCLLSTPRDAAACSCVDWSRVRVDAARQAFFDELSRADAAVSGTVLSRNSNATVISVGRVWKGLAPGRVRIFRRPDSKIEPPGTDCRPTLDLKTEYLILLFKQRDGSFEGERCAVWTGADRQQRLSWIGQINER